MIYNINCMHNNQTNKSWALCYQLFCLTVAMVASFLFSMAESLVSQLASPVYVEACKMLGVYNDLQHLTKSVSYIKGILLDAELKQMHGYSDHKLYNWLWRIRHVFSDAENLLDEVELENLQKKVIKVCRSCSNMIITKVNHFFSSCRMTGKIKQINKRLDKIAAGSNNFGLKIIDVDKRVVNRREMNYSRVINSDVIGREHDKEKIIKHLIQHDNYQNLSVVPIVGFRSVGKTTLAKLVFNDERINEYFLSKMWVCFRKL